MSRRVSEANLLRRITAEARKRGYGVIRLSLRPGVASGWPDLLILIPGGRALFVEVKRRGKAPTPLQKKRLNDLRTLGFPAYAVDQFAGACFTMSWVKSWVDWP